MKHKRVLVIGGAGFIGSHLCEKLVNDNEVWSLDNYFTGSVKNHINSVKYIEGCGANVNHFFHNVKFDYVFHFGEYSRVEQSLDEFRFVMENNIKPMASILEFVNSVGAKLIYAASSTRFSEEEKYLSPYTFTKCLNTDMIRAYDKWYGLNFSLAYFYNVYGGREIVQGKYATVVGKFVQAKKSPHNKVIITAPGTQCRNFTHIEDTVNALVRIAMLGDKESYLISAQEKYSIIELAEMLGLEYTIGPPKGGNRLDAHSDTRALRDLGWRQKYTLVDYIKKVICDG